MLLFQFLASFVNAKINSGLLADSYNRATQHLYKAEVTSDLSTTDAEQLGAGKRRKYKKEPFFVAPPKKARQSSTEEEEEDMFYSRAPCLTEEGMLL